MPLSALPFLILPYESVTYLLGLDAGETSQTLPATAVFSLAYILIRRGRLIFSPTGARVFRYLFLSFVCIILVTLANIVWDSFGDPGIHDELRMPTALRQGVSLILG